MLSLTVLTVVAMLNLVSLTSDTPMGEIRFTLLAAEKAQSNSRRHVELPYAQTSTHFALFRLREGHFTNIMCLTEPNRFNRLMSRTSMQVASGPYSVVPMPSLTACKSDQLSAEISANFSLSVKEGEAVEVSCKATKTLQAICSSSAVPTIERLR